MKHTLIRCGRLYDGIHPALSENREILVEGKLIREVGEHLAYPEGTEIVDLSALTVTPGMIDAHVHPEFFHYKDVGAVDTLFNSDGYRTLATYHTAEKSLYGGFTTIRTMGWWRESYELDVKRAINEGYLPGARLVVAPHFLGAPGSHGDMTQVARANPPLMDQLQHSYPGTGSGADFFTDAVRREAKIGADFIKIMVTGGFSTPNDDPEDIQLNDEELAAIFTTAKSLRKPVTAHVYGPELMQKLMAFGITGMEHGSLMDEKTARMAEETGTYLVPTFTPFHDAVMDDEASMQMKSPEFCRKLHKYQKRLQEGRAVTLASSIKLGYGTDIVTNYDSFDHGVEYRCWLESGADPFRALQAATKNNAEICGIDDIVGTIEAGKYADIAGWKRDLLKDPDALRDCGFVMKEGTVYPAESRMPA
ncbi:MAG: amidohydrolase family protein [Oscillospiraceae bacterium]|nr:amidohydrolase family protein [Oscillospiraceae bacterium]